MLITITVNVNIPALDSLVAYLKESVVQQQQIDDLASQVDTLTQGLHQSEARLASAIAQSKP